MFYQSILASALFFAVETEQADQIYSLSGTGQSGENGRDEDDGQISAILDNPFHLLCDELWQIIQPQTDSTKQQDGML